MRLRVCLLTEIRVRNLKFARNLKFVTSKTLVNFMKKMMFLSKNWYFSVQKALIYYTVNKSHHNSFILLVFSHVANFRYVANFRFLTLSAIKVLLELEFLPATSISLISGQILIIFGTCIPYVWKKFSTCLFFTCVKVI